MACEGPTDAAVLRKLLDWAGLERGPVHARQGKSQLDLRLKGYNLSARRVPWLVVRDLDRDADCAPSLVRELLPQPAEAMCFRLAVPQIEAWLLADRKGIAGFLGVSTDLIPVAPDELRNAKEKLVEIARRSRHRRLRADLVPPADFANAVGPGFTARITEFAELHWQPGLAAVASPSLASCIRALERLKGRI